MSLPLSPLREGSRVALVAPAGVFDAARFEAGRAAIEAAGFVAVAGRHLFARWGERAGTDAERAEDLAWAVKDPEIAAIFCVRGGYGSQRILPFLPFSSFRGHEKILLGYSDITALHAGFAARAGWVTFHGPNVIDLCARPGRVEATLAVLSGRESLAPSLSGARALREGSAVAPLLGGNLTVLCHLLGTPYFPETAGKILCIEDCGEALYRLDRLMTHLLLAGKLAHLSGLLLGEFTNCADCEKILDMVMERVRPFSYPVVAGLPFGHGEKNCVLALGARYRLETREGRCEPEFPVFLR